MKSDIHPKWYPEARVTCACGHSFTTGLTVPELRVEICSACHPFFTGEMKYVDTLGRVERFQAKQQQAQKAGPYVSKKQKRAQKKAAEDRTPKTLKEMLLGLK